MTTLEAIKNELEVIVTQEHLNWVVAVAPPAGYAGPCLAVVSWRLRPGETSSLSAYPLLEVELEATGMDVTNAEGARRVFTRLADGGFTSDDFVAIRGRLEDFAVARDEGPRQERWTARATVTFQVQEV
ncbi:MAG: hypothetical protein H5U08_00685 [Thermogutta sp.]|uniref:hypothetical protein n=1 Tax=Thermogutta sp. TaxID=1962930 RepID=UPI0019913703|nr:hypothetical protein [Thermogutta sp.]MBC7350851.1 hypothetical protein [Thermogutta sp.]